MKFFCRFQVIFRTKIFSVPSLFSHLTAWLQDPRPPWDHERQSDAVVVCGQQEIWPHMDLAAISRALEDPERYLFLYPPAMEWILSRWRVLWWDHWPHRKTVTRRKIRQRNESTWDLPRLLLEWKFWSSFWV